jgi:hypothetical protein
MVRRALDVRRHILITRDFREAHALKVPLHISEPKIFAFDSKRL